MRTDTTGRALAELPSGQVRYELVERIGGGAFGEVHRARAHLGGLTRDVCIKKLAGVVAPEHADALREEARLLASVRHANIVSLLALGESDGEPFLVLELVDGTDLRTLCRRLAGAFGDAAMLPDRVAVHVACAVLRGLAAVQRSLPGLVHRDATPHNVLVSTEGEVKLGDFGIALARDRTRWTRPTHVKGKLGYMSPEQIRGDDLDPRSDQFAVGVTLYELLAGVRPWAPLHGVRGLRAVLDRAPAPLRSHRPRVDSGLAACVDRLVSRERDDRHRTFDDALRALAPFGAGEAGPLRLAALLRAAQSNG